jgi:hypothetical protein
MATWIDRPATSEPPLVYPSPDTADHWIVETPAVAPETNRKPVTFTGPNALNSALRYAYEEFGSARFFPFLSPG